MKIGVSFLLSINLAFAGIGSSHGGSVISIKDILEYKDDFKVYIRSEQISFNSFVSTTFVPIINVCVEGDEYRTLLMYELYAPEKRDQVTIIGKDYLRRKIELDENNNQIRKNFNVVIYKVNKKDEREKIIKFGSFYIPNCE